MAKMRCIRRIAIKTLQSVFFGHTSGCTQPELVHGNLDNRLEATNRLMQIEIDISKPVIKQLLWLSEWIFSFAIADFQNKNTLIISRIQAENI
jgi:hypothetical protein